MAWPYKEIRSAASRSRTTRAGATGFSVTMCMACSSESHDTAVTLPEAPNGGFSRTRILLGLGDPTSHFHERRAFWIVSGTALDELVDAAVFKRYQACRTGQIALHD